MWWLKRGRELFRPHELVVIDAIAAELAVEARSLLERQVEATRRIVRLFDDREVYLYPSRGRSQRHDPATLFPNLTERDDKLAAVAIQGSSHSGTADAHVVHGHLLELVFRPRPRDLGDPGSVRVTRVRILADPMRSPDGDPPADLVARLEPAVRREVEAIWAADASTPLMTSDELYTVDLDDGEYVALAQLDDSTLLLAAVDPLRPGVRRFDLEGELVATYATLREAL